MTASGNRQSLVQCILDVSVVCVALVCTPDRYSIVDDRSPNYLVSHQYVSFCSPQDVPAKALRILFLLNTRSLFYVDIFVISLGIGPAVAVSPQ